MTADQNACKGCAAPDRGIFNANCRACTLRDIALGPWFHKSMSYGRLMAEYIAQLQPLGDDINAMHEEVKAAAKPAQVIRRHPPLGSGA